jgi:CYTH domain-containing protein
MGQEIERKFLVKGDFKNFVTEVYRIKQGYLSSARGRTVRVRVRDDKGYLTIKGEAGESGVSRYEWEKEIPYAEAEELLALCEPGLIDKTRYLVPAGEFTFEVDEFYGDNEGLIIAEIELKSESDQFPKPDWLGEEVTGDRRYYNSMLIKNPFTGW